MTHTGLRIAIGPCQYFWPRRQVLDFYAEIAETPADAVYLGETVCPKRRELRPADWIDLAEDLATAGKEVVLSTLTLVEARSEASVVQRICDNGRFRVEANEHGAVQRLRRKGVEFVGGPFLNIYNAGALRRLQEAGMTRWVPPLEMSRATLTELLAAAGERAPETEVFAHGRMPLAWSARCFTARHHGVPKDNCGLRCLDDPDGLAVHTRDGQRFLTINGIQTQSGRVCNLLPHWADLNDAGVDLLRVSPRLGHTAALVRTLRQVIDGAQSAQQLIGGDDDCDGFWFGQAGMERMPRTQASE